MEPAKTKSVNPTNNKAITDNETIIVSIDIEIIEPITEEIQYLEKEFQNWEERNDYNHLAYSQY